MKNVKKKILILCPSFSDQGGVANYYALVDRYFHSERISINFFHTGKDYSKTTNRIFKSLLDLINLIETIPRYDLIVLNPSLDFKALIRDGFYHILAKRFFNKRTIVFFRGWQKTTELEIDRYYRHFFTYIFNSDQFCVLAEDFANKLSRWGAKPASIHTETTTYESYEIEYRKDFFKLIFLSRFEPHKGALTAIQTIEALCKEFPNIVLFMAGDGILYPSLKTYVVNHNLSKHIIFTGYITGRKKYSLLKQCGIMLYPSDYGEGMPNSLIEAMGMGLIIISKPVGGIPDVVKEYENGFLITQHDSSAFVKKIKFLLQNYNLCTQISQKNTLKAKNNFEIKIVVRRLEKLFLETANK